MIQLLKNLLIIIVFQQITSLQSKSKTMKKLFNIICLLSQNWQTKETDQCLQWIEAEGNKTNL